MAQESGKQPLVLVTGAAGLIGTRVLRALAPHFKTVAFDLVEPAADTAAEFIRCDLTKDESLAEALAQLRERHGGTLASVIHLAAYYDFSGEPSPLYHDLTVEGTRRLLRGLRGFDVVQFVFPTSLLVMRPARPGFVLNESSPTQAEWAYPQSKLATEAVITEARGRIPALVLRIAGAYDEDCHSIPIAQQIRRIYEKEFESVFFPGNPDLGQSFVHLDDVADCFLRAVQRRDVLVPKELLLIGEPGVVSYGEMQERIGEALHGTAWPTIRIPKTVAKAGAWVQEQLAGEDATFIKPWMVDLADAHYPVDPRRAKDKLGWEPRHALRRTLGPMLDRLKSDPQRWYKTNKLPIPEEMKT